MARKINRTRVRSATATAGRVLTLAIAAAALAACTPHISRWSPAQSPKNNKIDWISFNHVVNFTPAQGDVSEREQQRLTRFLADHAVGYGDRIFVGAPGRKPSGKAGRSAERRSNAVESFLRRNRLFPVPLPSSGEAALWTGSITVVIGRYVVTPPRCPDWSKPATGDPSNQVGSNYGCAMATNLGVMIADPGDLVRGRDPGPTNGEAAARAVERYRADQVKKPAEVSTKGSGG